MSKFFKILNRLTFIKKNFATKEYDNAFQGELLDAVMNSGTARNCIDKRAAYVFGNGFIDELTAKAKANDKQTFNKFFADTANNVALFKTVSWMVRVGIDGKPYSIKNIPSQKVKIKSDGNFTYNPTLFTPDFDRNLDLEYEPYRPDFTDEQRKEQVAKQIKQFTHQRGFIFYSIIKSIGADHYAIPNAYSGLEDILTDHELSAYELENLQNGFLPSAILTLIGQLDDTIKDEKTGLTEKEVVQKNLKQFTSKEGGRSKLMVMSADTKEQVPNLAQLDVGKVLEGLEKITDRIGRKVCRLFEVPPVLAGFEDASILGSNQTFKNALIGLQHSVIKDQELILEGLKQIFPEKNFEISELKLIDYIPSEVLAKLTDDELRALGGYEPIQVDTSNSAQQTLNSLNTLSPLVANKVLESMSDEEIRSLIGLSGTKPA